MRWEDIGGLEEVKAEIRQVAEWPLLYPETFARLGAQPAKGILLYGPPGCAKTTIVRALATSCKASFHSLNGAQIFSPYLGDAELVVRQTFKRARLGAPAILFLDEIDAIVGNRAAGSQSGGVQVRIACSIWSVPLIILKFHFWAFRTQPLERSFWRFVASCLLLRTAPTVLFLNQILSFWLWNVTTMNV